MKPQELDVVRLLRPLPEHNLAAGAKGTVVVDYSANSTKQLPRAYEVEFCDSEGFTIAVVASVPEADLVVIWRLGVGDV